MSTPSDRELLEKAAKAAGLQLARWDDGGQMHLGPVAIIAKEDGTTYGWRPLTDDGDALRLAVAVSLRMDNCLRIFPPDKFDPWAVVRDWEALNARDGSDDPYAATRRAIVKAAASLSDSSQ